MKKKLFLVLCTMMCLVGCKSGKVLTNTEYVTLHDTVQTYREKVDSVYQHDSIYIHQNGDTIYSERWHTKYKYKYLTRDSIVIKRDTVSVTQTKTEQVKYIPTWVKYLAWFGALVLISFLIYIAILVYKEYKARGI